MRRHERENLCDTTQMPAEKLDNDVWDQAVPKIQLLYGQRFTITTDHKPLISLFREKKPVPQMGHQECKGQQHS